MTVALVVFVLVLLNAFFVAAEFAIISAPRATIEHHAASGSKLALEVLEVLRDPRKQDRYIATAQLGITSASLGLGMYGEHQLAEALLGPLERAGLPPYLSAHTIASVLAVAMLTYVHIVLGEMIPKTLALQTPAGTAIFVGPTMRFASRLLYPLVVVFDAIGRLCLRILGVRRDLAPKAPTVEALELIVAESTEKGELSPDAGQVLADLFAFKGLTAAEVMTPRVHVDAIAKGATHEAIERALTTSLHARYPVYDGTIDRVVGIVLVRDLLDHLARRAPLADDVIRPVPFVAETTPLDTVLAYMRRDRTQLVVVMDEHGGTEGIVTVEDLFEEVVGEITDSPLESAPVEEHPTGERRAMGTARLDEVGEELGRELVHPDVDTVSGLVLSLLDRPPIVGDVVTWSGVEWRVVEVDGHGVGACVVRVLADEDETTDD